MGEFISACATDSSRRKASSSITTWEQFFFWKRCLCKDCKCSLLSLFFLFHAVFGFWDLPCFFYLPNFTNLPTVDREIEIHRYHFWNFWINLPWNIKQQLGAVFLFCFDFREIEKKAGNLFNADSGSKPSDMLLVFQLWRPFGTCWSNLIILFGAKICIGTSWLNLLNAPTWRLVAPPKIKLVKLSHGCTD